MLYDPNGDMSGPERYADAAQPIGFNRLVHELLEQYDDIEDVTTRVCNHIRLSNDQRMFLWALIRSAVDNVKRNDVRQLEKAAKPGKFGRPVNPTEDMQRLTDETFALGDGSRVRWGDATIKQHEARIDYLAKQRDGIDATIQRHRAVIEQLRAAGVSCLNELKDAA